ncbi:MAG: hypothetical protein DHS20C21_13850 [Gemmatimonadota bacterium]|nr:MAG: hypothetical protein DHS20C21_13850 [Gemmatimonadota bacterium]
MARRRTVTLRDQAQLRAISSPLAHRIVGAMEHLDRATVPEIAEFIGAPAGSLYYHVRKMKSVGLLRQVAQQETARRSRAIYQLSGREVSVDVPSLSRAGLRELHRNRRIMLRFAERSLEDGARRAQASSGPSPGACLIQRHVRLGRRDVVELNRRLEALAAWVADRTPPRKATGYVLTLALGTLPEG